MKIPHYLIQDEYLQVPIMRRFLQEHSIKGKNDLSEMRIAIEEFADQSDANKQAVYEWLEEVVREGSKELCYKKLYDIEDYYFQPQYVRTLLNNAYPDCPNVELMQYRSTGMKTLINYKIIESDDGKVERIDFTFTQLLLREDTKASTQQQKIGSPIVYPTFVRIYMKEGFILSLCKAKSTLYKYDADNPVLLSEFKIDTMKEAVESIAEIITKLRLKTQTNPRIVRSDVAKTLFNIYHQFTFTPEDVVKKIETQKAGVRSFIDGVFSNLSLDSRNKIKAIQDAEILVEKYISINGDNEEIFKSDRDAYLIKVAADDEQQLSKIDTTSMKRYPLQCTEMFFDSKKAVMDGKQCQVLHLVFKRNNTKYFPVANQLTVQFGTKNDFGYIKIMQYAEEADINNVLQTVFSNYGGL